MLAIVLALTGPAERLPTTRGDLAGYGRLLQELYVMY